MWQNIYLPAPDVYRPVLILTFSPDLLLLLNPFSLSISQANFPSRWKTSIIVLHYKKGYFHDSGNIRLVNHISPPYMLMEKLLMNNYQATLLLVTLSTLHNADSWGADLASFARWTTWIWLSKMPVYTGQFL